MKTFTQKMLQSGLIDRHTALMLEKWGSLPNGSTEIIKDDALRNATKAQLIRLAEELETEMDRLESLKEMQFDLKDLRWSTEVSILSPDNIQIAYKVPAVIDRLGRFYFRIQDVDPDWFIPGFRVNRETVNRANGAAREIVIEEILESTPLYVDDEPICIQVMVHKIQISRSKNG